MVYINTTGKHNEVWLDKPYATITVECPDCPSTEDAYNSGWTDGSEDGYHKGYQSGRTDGYDDGWGPGYQSGYTDGLEACSGGSCEGIWEDGYLSGVTDQKSLLTSTAITQNGAYSNYDSGWSSVLVNVRPHNQNIFLNILNNTSELPVRYDGTGYVFENVVEYIRANSGYTGLGEVGLYMYIWPGEALQQGFSSGYTSGYTDGLNACSGYTQEDLDAAFASGYTAGLRDCSGYTPATSITLNVDSAITGTGQANVTVNPSDAGTDITYTSSDPSVATIDENGTITVLQDGTVTFCAVDNLTQLQDCKTVSVSLPIPANTSMLDLIYETTEPNQTIRLFHGEAANDNGFFYTFYSGITKMVIDGVEVAKSEDNIHKSYPRSADWYIYTFPTAGRHNVKFYVDRSFSAHTDTGWMFPAYELRDQLFGAYSLTLPEFPLVEAHIGEGYETIRGGVFQGNTNVTAVTLPSTMVTLYAYPFEYSGIHSIEIPDSVSAITTFQTSGTFNNCASLTSATFGTGITQIGNNTFSACTALTEITFNGVTPPTLLNANSLLTYGTDTFPIYVPTSAVSAYQNEPSWADYASRVQAKP